MIIYNNRVPLKKQIEDDIQELEAYKKDYSEKILEYNKSCNYINSLLKDEECTQMASTVSRTSKEKVKVFNTQIAKIDRNLETLSNLLNNIDSLDKKDIIKQINKYNKKYNEIKRNTTINTSTFNLNAKENYKSDNSIDQFSGNAITQEKNITDTNIEEKITIIANTNINPAVNTNANTNSNIENSTTVEQNIENRTEEELQNSVNGDYEMEKTSQNNVSEEYGIESNDTLLISEILGKVILPYSKSEILELLKDENNTYKTAQEVIDDRFTKPLSAYRFQYWSRYNETIKLLTKRESFRLSDAITLALEIVRKRYLHPAIISACRSLDELDVYLDCLDKNELDEFKIFKIKYELHPILVKQNKNPFKDISLPKQPNTNRSIS